MEKLEIKNIKLHYFTSKGVIHALDGVSFDLRAGETLGVVGESGCGKTTLGTALLNMPTPPGRIVDGEILIDGVDILKLNENELRKQIRWEKIAMVFQGAMNCLTPVYTIRKQMMETILSHRKMTKEEAEARIIKY